MDGWINGWMDGWMDGWMYANLFFLRLVSSKEVFVLTIKVNFEI